MTPVELSRTVLRAMRQAVDAGELSVDMDMDMDGDGDLGLGRELDASVEAGRLPVRVERPRPGGSGDYATNVALQIARAAGRTPRHVAEVLAPRLAAEPGIAGVDISGPGFLNITLAGARDEALVREILERGPCYGHVHPDTGAVAQIHVPREIRAVVVADSVRRILRSQGVLVRVTCDDAPDPAWVDVLGVRVDAHGRPPQPLPTLRPVPATAPVHATATSPEGSGPLRLGRDAARWALLHPAAHDRPRITPEQGGDQHLVQRESNPLFRVRYAHARSRALTRNAADLGFTAAPGNIAAPGSTAAPGNTAALGDTAEPRSSAVPREPATPHDAAAPSDTAAPRDTAAPGDITASRNTAAPGDITAPCTTAAPGSTTTPHPATPHPATPLLDALAAYPTVLASAARHRAPDRLARHLVVTADAFLSFQCAPQGPTSQSANAPEGPTRGAARGQAAGQAVLPVGDEKPSAAHRARLALAEAAGTVLAGGLSLLGISAPDHL
ncbi:ArgS-related anticodon-binding protein NrtL [Streptomyces sp. NPDC050732]|uniref:ArgS-related anticodon-binding protein NrtL n=1 Tax=Streptomyces sp. NPDC050732 TaxID=3154632 RepID=UPI00342127FC